MRGEGPRILAREHELKCPDVTPTRIGDDPAVLLRVYAKLTKKPHDGMADAVNALATNFLKK